MEVLPSLGTCLCVGCKKKKDKSLLFAFNVHICLET